MAADWPDILVEHASSELTARRLIAQLRACEASALAFCRLLERWGKGEARPATDSAVCCIPIAAPLRA